MGFKYCVELFPQRCICISAFLEGVDFKVNLFVNPFEWTKVSDSQILFNKKYGAFRPQMYFVITEKVKQSRVGTHLKPVEFLAYPEDEKLCVIKHLREYIKKTQVLRGDCSQLLLSHVKPHGPASKDTISRWCKNVLKFAGIDVSKFTAHSTRSASTSFLAERNVNIKDIMTSAGWSNEMTFQRYYRKPVGNTFNFGDTILQLADSDN